MVENQNGNMESWLYVHFGILLILGYDYEVGHWEACGILLL